MTRAAGMTELSERLCFDLSDTLTGDVEHASHLLKEGTVGLQRDLLQGDRADGRKACGKLLAKRAVKEGRVGRGKRAQPLGFNKSHN